MLIMFACVEMWAFHGRNVAPSVGDASLEKSTHHPRNAPDTAHGMPTFPPMIRPYPDDKDAAGEVASGLFTACSADTLVLQW
jgi:hypothetical protein